MSRLTKKSSDIVIESVKHKDQRVNIPTEELREFVADEERSSKTLLYPRDPSLDPQLVWKGKDEQDTQDLAVPAVPIYIQEKIHPQAIIENVRAQARKGAPEQFSFFDDFNGIDDFEKKVDFYHWGMNWSNRMILGDSLLVMASLAEKEGLKGQVQMIYIDPPYGIKFGSNWQVSTRKRDVKDGKVGDVTRQPEQIRAFRDTWQLGIHSYLSYLRDRLMVARELLTETGSIFVQIGDENVHLVRCLLDEVFGSENICAVVTFSKTSPLGTDLLPSTSDFILWYAKNRDYVKYRQQFMEKRPGEFGASRYTGVELENGKRVRISEWEGNVEDVRLFADSDASAMFTTPHLSLPFGFQGNLFEPNRGRQWQTTQEGMRRLAFSNRLMVQGKNLRFVRYLDDFPVNPLSNVWTDIGGIQSRSDPKIYAVQTSTSAIERCMLMTTDPGDLVLDPTCGSGTTAYVAEQWGRRWITIDTSRVALALARTRIMAARYPYYLLADSPEGVKKDAELRGQLPSIPLPSTGNDVKKGFVYRRVPHVTLKSIATNEEIDVIHARWQEHLDPVRLELNRLLKQTWEEWEIPREAKQEWPGRAKELLGEWWQMRRERQGEIDASIARHADTEILYDQPYEDNRRIRVAGPFTVESLSPHRVLSTDEERPVSERKPIEESAAGQFSTMILDNLKKAGIQNTRKQERLKLEKLEPYPGAWLQATGEYTDAEGVIRRVAVSLGPEHGTVGSEQVKEAAKEALRGVGFDLLVVCGFAFDAHAGETAKEFSPEPAGKAGFVTEETRQYGRLPVLLARINPDLTMGDTLLKNTGAGNLFTVFGEPDVDLMGQPDGKIVLEIKGLDIYDPTTGEVRSSSTDDIACWFVDTDYNGESFFVRHAYFTGADEPYERLKRVLRAEIDEAAWSALYSTRSQPFDPPSAGKIAVKVINHYGDEVLKVFPI